MAVLRCYFHFRSPYSYLGVLQLLDAAVPATFIPLCLLPGDIPFADPTANPWKWAYIRGEALQGAMDDPARHGGEYLAAIGRDRAFGVPFCAVEDDGGNVQRFWGHERIPGAMAALQKA
ncbi:MAG: hypothetical protein ACFCBW_18800 [Candidatus Competibacterales bacterium]